MVMLTGGHPTQGLGAVSDRVSKCGQESERRKRRCSSIHDGTMQKILGHLRQQSATANALSATFGCTYGAVYNCLKRLQSLGQVTKVGTVPTGKKNQAVWGVIDNENKSEESTCRNLENGI